MLIYDPFWLGCEVKLLCGSLPSVKECKSISTERERERESLDDARVCVCVTKYMQAAELVIDERERGKWMWGEVKGQWGRQQTVVLVISRRWIRQDRAATTDFTISLHIFIKVHNYVVG